MKPKVNKLPLNAHLAYDQRHELLKMQEDGMKFSDPYILSATEAAKEERKTRLHIEKWPFDKSFFAFTWTLFRERFKSYVLKM